MSESANQDHFLKRTIEEDIAGGRWGAPGDKSVVRTRFPPEPNGFLHIGHAKSICLNFGLAEQFGGSCNLRFDDTNPVKEDKLFVESIVRDVRWLGFRWPGASESDPIEGVRFASDYFQLMHDCAVDLIKKGLAYVDDQTPEQIREGRGAPGVPGTNSPFRDRPIEESLELFEKMVAGEFPEGSRVLRAKIDMASPNFNMRDPVMYRIVRSPHHRTGDSWCVYPMYDWAHGLEDSVEWITHSICTLEFEDHRPLYDWFIRSINKGRSEPLHHPQQIEFARLNLGYTVMSKRRLKQLVDEKRVEGWDDPRMPSIAGYRRRGYTPESVRSFCRDIGVSRFNSLIDPGRLENACREHLNAVAPRRMAVLRPLKVVVENFPEGETRYIEAVNNPEDASAGVRQVPFTRELYIERDDFMEDPPKKFFRLGPGREVRLRYACLLTCIEAVKDASGEVVELRCTYDPETWGGKNPPDGRKVKGTLHWVSAEHGVQAEVRNYDRLFSIEDPNHTPKGAPEGWSFLDAINPDSLEIVSGAVLEPALADDPASSNEPAWPDGIRRVQFERHGYYCVDDASTPGRPVWNRTVSLKDSWAKIAQKG